MNSALPVFRGEIQCRMLGMAVETFTPTGVRCAAGEPGELVCVKPFPCQPVGFWPLPGYGSDEEVAQAKARYQQAYFAEFEGVWCEWQLCRETTWSGTDDVMWARPWRPRSHHALEGWQWRGSDYVGKERWCAVSTYA